MKEVVKEELVYYPEGRETRLFRRIKGQNIEFGSHLKGEKKIIEKLLLPNVLFLSRAANMNQTQLKEIYLFFKNEMNFHTSMDSRHNLFYETTLGIKKSENDLFKKKVLGFLNAADINIRNIEIETDSGQGENIRFPDEMPDDLRNRLKTAIIFKPKMEHYLFNDAGEKEGTIYFDLEDEESGGTIKMYDLAGEVITALEEGTTLIIDEFDSGLHPLLNRYIIGLFNDPETNPRNAQLVAATHDTCMMGDERIHRDQIWFTDKNEYGATELYSLDEFDKNQIRRKAPFAKWYLDGRLKAVPSINKKSFINFLEFDDA